MNISRKINDQINSDRTIIELRMQSEDLINNMEHLTREEYEEQARKISQLIDQRTIEIINEINR